MTQEKLYVVGINGWAMVSRFDGKQLDISSDEFGALLFRNYKDAYNMVRRINRNSGREVFVITLTASRYKPYYWKVLKENAKK